MNSYIKRHAPQLCVAVALVVAYVTGIASAEQVSMAGMALATADYWSDSDLKALAYGGLVNEDVMQKIWDISQIPLPFTDLVGYGEPLKGTPYAWTQDSQAAVDLTNASVDGADAATNNAAGGVRVQNHAQICDKLVEVSERAQAVDTIGRANERAYQISMRQRDNRRDIEAISIYQQASVADNGDSTAGKVGAFPTWLETNTNFETGGADGGFQTDDGLVDLPTYGTSNAALDASKLGDLIENIYNANGNVSVLMSRPAVIRKINQFILATPESFATATPTANVATASPTGQVAQGYINIIITDFGTTLDIIPNRLQQLYDTDHTDLLLIDTGMVELANLIPEHTERLGKQGTADRDQISQQWGLRVLDEAAHGVYRDIDEDATMIA